MSVTKTLGGDRLGSGKKMKVEMHGFERSTHDLSYAFRSTMSPGTLVPFLNKVALPGDTWDINLSCMMMTHPTIGPLFGSYKIQLDVFLTPIRNYNSWLHNNRTKVGLNISQIKLPQITLRATPVSNNGSVEDVNNSQINPSCILKYLGISGVGIPGLSTGTTRKFNGISLLNYWDIVKNYYTNKQEEVGAVIHSTITINETVNEFNVSGTGGGNLPQYPTTGFVQLAAGTAITITYTGTAPAITDIILILSDGREIDGTYFFISYTDDGAGNIDGYWNWQDYGDQIGISWRYRTATDPNELVPQVQFFDLEEIDDMRNNLLATAGNVAFDINAQNLAPYKYLLDAAGDSNVYMNSQEGLALKCYQSDLHNNWLNTEWIDGTGGIADITAVDTSSGDFKIDQLILARKLYDYLNRVAVSGGTYDDWQEATYDHEPRKRAEIPMYMGGLIKELEFSEVVSNSQTNDQPLGTLAGKGFLNSKHKGGYININVDEISYVTGIISITPRLDYSQGNDFDTHYETMDDFHKPPMDQIGFQELITEQLAWWDTQWDTGTSTWVTKSAGKQPAWVNYMTAVNKTFGNFAIENNEMFMTLNRRYEWEADGDFFKIKDLTTYIDPVKYNQIFAQTAIDAQNFWVQVGVGLEVRRKMSNKVMPNL
jgi:hypothetical protein